MNDRELAQWLKYNADASRQPGLHNVAEHLDAAAARIKELGRKVADQLEEEIYKGCVVRDTDTGWVTIELHRRDVVNAARGLIRMGLWEANKDLDDIEHIEARPLKGNQ